MFGLGTLTRVAKEITRDLTAAQERDPAARTLGRTEILLTYGGVQALLSHRVAHALNDAGIPLAPHALAYASKVATGVEIHPAARVGDSLFIDHGAGVVIGETAEIGDNVTLYQGVTLGGTGFQRGKRHPTVDSDVVIGSGAKLLGPIHVGRGAKVGPVRVEGRRPDGPDADWAHLPDPVADAIKALSQRVAELERLLAETTGHEPRPAAEVRPLRKRGQDPAGG
jgi:serine O-acetyltransferase